MENHTCIPLRAMADGNIIFPGEINLPNSLTIMQPKTTKSSVVCNKLGVLLHLVRLLVKSDQYLGYVFKSSKYMVFYLMVNYKGKNMKIVLN